jgi:hypothetical protein
MSERWSKVLLSVEALLIAVPVTLLFVFYAPDEVIRVTALSVNWGSSLVVLLVGGVSLLIGWWLMIRFVIGGGPALRSVIPFIWALLYVAACVAVLACALVLFRGASPILTVLSKRFGVLALGAPLLVPLVHLVLERRVRLAANNALERERGR